MPFPLAHPAAVLPFRRACPRRLSFPALVIGSVVPDTGYLFGKLHLAGFTHSFPVGVVGFCLPVGASLFCLHRLVQCLLLRWVAPGQWRQLLLSYHLNGPGPLLIGISLLLGAWTHDLLDAVTHADGWIVERMPLLQRSFRLIGPEPLAVCDLLYCALTFFGVVWVAVAYLRWLDSTIRQRPSPLWKNSITAISLALAISFVSMAGRAPYVRVGDIRTALATCLLVAGFLWVTRCNFATAPR